LKNFSEFSGFNLSAIYSKENRHKPPISLIIGRNSTKPAGQAVKNQRYWKQETRQTGQSLTQAKPARALALCAAYTKTLEIGLSIPPMSEHAAIRCFRLKYTSQENV